MRRKSRRGSVWMPVLLGLIVSVEAFGMGFWFADAGASAQQDPIQLPQNDDHRDAREDLETARQIAEARTAELESELSRLRSEIAWLHTHMGDGYLHLRKVSLNRVHTAYALLPPKLLISVHSLRGNDVIATFGSETHQFSVGERYDFSFEDLTCFLQLAAMEQGHATFDFGCQLART
ncbi:MAG: hypothetical protein AAGF71_04485 [Pseudomonadota bacterium]